MRAERRARPITCGLVDRGLQLLSARRPHRAQPRSNVKLFQAVVPAARESAAWTLRDAAPGAALGSFGVLHGGIGCCSGIGESPPHSVSDADNPEAVRTAAGRSGTVSLRAAHFSGAAHLGERSCVAVGSERGTEANNRVGPARFGAEANGCDGGGRFRMLPASSFGLDEAAGGSQRRAAAGARWIPSCAGLARFRATVTNSTMSAASTTVAAAGWGEDRRGEEGAEGETNAVTACRGRRTAGRLCARCFRAVAGAWPAGACSRWLRGELIVDQSEEPRAFSRFLCGGCIEINIRR